MHEVRRAEPVEQARAASSRRHRPTIIALALGALMMGPGILLFVSAQWDMLSPQARCALVLLFVGVFHVVGTAVSARAPSLSLTLHAIGTVALGAGIFLVGPIFNLDDHWPSGLMLWTLGAALAWALLRDWRQMALIAIVTPAWLSAEWLVASEPFITLLGHRSAMYRIPAAGQFLLTLSYLTAMEPARSSLVRRVLCWLGGLSLLPTAIMLALSIGSMDRWASAPISPDATGLLALGWIVAIGLPLSVAAALRRAHAWPNVLAAVWVIVLINLPRFEAIHEFSPYAWWALGAIGLVAWGVRERRPERTVLGGALLAATALLFSLAQAMK